MRTLIHSARLVTDGAIDPHGWLLIDGAKISAVGHGEVPQEFSDRADDQVDAACSWLTPGFIDLHCHGAGGASFDDGQAQIEAGLVVHRRHGTTRSAISLVTAALPDLIHRLTEAVAVAERDPLVLGAHLEGPFLDETHRGAHDRSLLMDPSPHAVETLLAAGRGRICQVTVAPERTGGLGAISAFTAAGVVAAVGHTSADYDQASAAFDSGATILTHAFNGMEGIHHRAPGPVAAATHTPTVTIEIINDGVHVHPEVVRILFASAPGRVALVTDAMAAADAADGDYRLGSVDVVVADGVARLRGGGSIAGSTLTQDGALRRAVRAVGLPLETAVLALTATPAAAIGRGRDLGRLVAGYAADAVLLDDDLRVTAVWGAGRRLA